MSKENLMAAQIMVFSHFLPDGCCQLRKADFLEVLPEEYRSTGAELVETSAFCCAGEQICFIENSSPIKRSVYGVIYPFYSRLKGILYSASSGNESLLSPSECLIKLAKLLPSVPNERTENPAVCAARDLVDGFRFCTSSLPELLMAAPKVLADYTYAVKWKPLICLLANILRETDDIPVFEKMLTYKQLSDLSRFFGNDGDAVRFLFLCRKEAAR